MTQSAFKPKNSHLDVIREHNTHKEEDEEEEPSTSDFAYSKPTRGGASVNTKPKGRGKPQKIALDDDNFPEL